MNRQTHPSDRLVSILVLESGRHWLGGLRRFAPLNPVIAVLDLEDLEAELADRTGAIACLEIDLTAPRWERRLTWVWEHRNNPWQACIFAVGDARLEQSAVGLNRAGFHHVFPGFGSLVQLPKIIERHQQRVVWPPETLEQQIQNRLPWHPVPKPAPSNRSTEC